MPIKVKGRQSAKWQFLAPSVGFAEVAIIPCHDALLTAKSKDYTALHRSARNSFGRASWDSNSVQGLLTSRVFQNDASKREFSYGFLFL